MLICWNIIIVLLSPQIVKKKTITVFDSVLEPFLSFLDLFCCLDIDWLSIVCSVSEQDLNLDLDILKLSAGIHD